MTTSFSTLLRLLHQLEALTIGKPRVIGIDDWAFRKGRSYGTIIIDHNLANSDNLLLKPGAFKAFLMRLRRKIMLQDTYP